MLTEQSYPGGGSHANPNEQTAPEAGQTVDSATQTASGPVLVPLTSYFRKVTATRAGTAAFRHLLASVFQSYATSGEFIGQAAKENDNSVDVLHSMFSGIVAFVERTTDRRLGDVLLRDSGPIPGEVSAPVAPVDPSEHVLYSGNPLAVTDVNALQEWVLALQNKCSILATERESTVSELTEKVELQTARLKVAKAQIARLEGQQPATPVTPTAPVTPKPAQAEHSLGLNLYLGHYNEGTSQVDLVWFALDAYHKTMLHDFASSVASADYENAYHSFLDAETLLGIMLDMGINLNRLAENNLRAAKREPLRNPGLKPSFGDFMKKYLPGVDY